MKHHVNGHEHNHDRIFSNIKTLKFCGQITVLAYGETYTCEVRKNKLVASDDMTTIEELKSRECVTLIDCHSLYHRVARAVCIEVNNHLTKSNQLILFNTVGIKHSQQRNNLSNNPLECFVPQRQSDIHPILKHLPIRRVGQVYKRHGTTSIPSRTCPYNIFVCSEYFAIAKIIEGVRTSETLLLPIPKFAILIIWLVVRPPAFRRPP